MRQALQRAWLRRGVLARLLWPLSALFGVLAALRRHAYRSGFLKSQGVAVPVIVVGNVLVGGSGKTPVVIALVEHLHLRGITPGVVSRGYGRDTSDCREVKHSSRANEVGDEPLLIAQACRAPVFVAASRVEAARALLRAYPATQVIICDDGLQHYALQRDIEVCVFDERGTGNGWLLPAGPLREPWPRKVDLIVRTAGARRVGGFEATRQLAPYARRADGTRTDLVALRGRPIKAIAAIARPDAFFAMLRNAGLQLDETVALPDHYAFTGPVPKPDSSVLICTEKDAVKLWVHNPQAWAVPLVLTIEPQFWLALDLLLSAKLGAKLSSANGSQTS